MASADRDILFFKLFRKVIEMTKIPVKEIWKLNIQLLYIILYMGLEHQQILVSAGEQIPPGY